MCGIVGLLGRAGDATGMAAIVRAMAASVAHRGPDGQGIWVDHEAGLALGHRRLAVIDPSPAGDQPMLSIGGRFALVLNGEIYNFRRLRSELEAGGYPFFGGSDTEVLLAAIDYWGMAVALERIEGMFAFALWDLSRRELTLVRDRVGKKPLYYGWFDRTFVFGSELCALRAHPAFAGEIDREALGEYARDGWYGGERTVYRGVRRLRPASFLRVGADDAEPAVQQTYWSAAAVAAAAAEQPFAGSYDEAVAALDGLLGLAVRDRLHADVPIGALLSGGIDSSLVVAAMAEASARPVRTFSIGFTEPRFDEAPFARAVAHHLGTEHCEVYVGPEQATAVIPRLAGLYDEPLGDHSQLPTVLLAELARGEVTVALSGDGGDELFLGYGYYERCLRQWQNIRHLPPSLGALTSGIGSAMGRGAWAASGGGCGFAARALRKLGRRLDRGTRHFPSRRPEELLLRSTARSRGVAGLVLGARPDPLAHLKEWAQLDDPVRAMAFADFTDLLPEDILAKVDRASMSVGLEVRSPLLDRRVVEFAWSLPTGFLLDARCGKRILRDILARRVPAALTERPKRGFGLPVDRWLRGHLRPWAEDLLAEPALRRQGLFDVGRLRQVWRQHLVGWADHGDLLWTVLMFQGWSHGHDAAVTR